MKDLAPEIFRQRLVIEGYWTVELMNEAAVRGYLLGLADHLGLRSYGEPVIFSPESGIGREENAGYDAFLPLIDSGIAGYFWSHAKFLSVVVYSCKEFDPDRAVAYTRQRFGMSGEIATAVF